MKESESILNVMKSATGIIGGPVVLLNSNQMTATSYFGEVSLGTLTYKFAGRCS